MVMMETVQTNGELASTPRWFISLTGTYIASLFVWGILITAGSAIALLILPHVIPTTSAFGWLAISGVVLAIVDPDLTDEEADLVINLTERVLEQPRRAKVIYGLTVFLLMLGMLSILTGVVAVTATYLSQTSGVFAIIFAVLYPSIDVAIGRYVGWNIASFGASAILIAMMIVAWIYQVPTSVPRRAAADLHDSFSA